MKMNNFIEQISCVPFYKVNDIKKNVTLLTDKQRKRANLLLRQLLENNDNGNLQICLRGENYRNLSAKLFTERERNSNVFSLEFYRRCFMLGDKAKTYYLCNYNTNNPIPWSFDIAKVNSSDFDFIFYELSYFVKQNNSSWKVSNLEFVNYFSNNNNKPGFKTLLSNLSPDEQLIIRDYYCWLLHTAATERFQSHSYYVSATTDPEMCYNFSNDNGPLAVVYFIPHPSSTLSTSLQTLLYANQSLTSQGLPVIESEVYPDEFEVSIKGGLFPHFIIGFYEYESNRFVFNHNIFKKYNRSNKKIFSNGIKIDQSDFFDYLKKTSYNRGVGLLSNGNYTNI